MNRTMLSRLAPLASVAFVAMSACTMKNQDAPALSGPSEFGTSVTVSVTPDVLTQDGASQSLVTVTARDSAGSPLRSLSMRSEIWVGGVVADFGSLSARNIVTGSDGRATLVYTAPAAPAVSPDKNTVVTIAVTPIGSDYANSSTRIASIRLVPPGVVIPPDGLRAAFTANPTTPTDHQVVLFDAGSSYASPLTPIVSYSWNYGDGATGSGKTSTHSFAAGGTYVVSLTVSDAYGRSASVSQSLTVAGGANPTASFVYSPTSPLVTQVVNFNASASRAATGRSITAYSWDFGDGEQKTGSSALTTHDYMTPGTFAVTLTITDDAGRTATVTQSLAVSTDAPRADFTFSPSAPAPAATVFFNSANSVVIPGRSITAHFWTFGDGSTSAAATPSHAFGAAGSYNVTLTITDSAGKTGSVTKTVSVK